MTDVTARVPDPLKLQECPACHYSLRGLGDAGVCPECGRAFDDNTVVLHGYARGSFAHVGNARPWVALVLALIPAVHLFNLVNNPSGGRRWVFAFVVVWILFLLWALVRRRQLEAPAPAQIHLSAEGCRQFDVARAEAGLAQPPTPWSKIEKVVVEPVWENRVRIKLVERTPWWKLEAARVDAEIPGGPDLLAALDARVRYWHELGHADDPTGGFPVIPLNDNVKTTPQPARTERAGEL
jgi:hypothetical protein